VQKYKAEKEQIKENKVKGGKAEVIQKYLRGRIARKQWQTQLVNQLAKNLADLEKMKVVYF